MRGFTVRNDFFQTPAMPSFYLRYNVCREKGPLYAVHGFTPYCFPMAGCSFQSSLRETPWFDSRVLSFHFFF